MKFHTTEEENKMVENMVLKYPEVPYDYISLIVWCYVNRPEKYYEIVNKYTDKKDCDLINLDEVDYVKLFTPEN